MPNHSLCIIIVNYRTGNLVANSLRRIALFREEGRFAGIDVTVVVVDNNSSDDSTDLIAATIQQIDADRWCALVRSRNNGGFSSGNNQGFRKAIENRWGKDYFLLLNPDAFLLEDTCSNLIDFSQSLSTPGIVGCTQLDESGEIRPSAFRFPTPLTEFQRGAKIGILERLIPRASIVKFVSDTPVRADWVTGAALLLPRPVYAIVGDFDEDFFLYYEEVEYMHRAKRCGFEVWSLPAAKVVHFAGASTGIKKGVSKSKKMPAYWYNSWSNYFLKTGGRGRKYYCAASWLAGHVINLALSIIFAHRRTNTLSIADFIRYSIVGRRYDSP